MTRIAPLVDQLFAAVDQDDPLTPLDAAYLELLREDQGLTTLAMMRDVLDLEAKGVLPSHAQRAVGERYGLTRPNVYKRVRNANTKAELLRCGHGATSRKPTGYLAEKIAKMKARQAVEDYRAETARLHSDDTGDDDDY